MFFRTLLDLLLVLTTATHSPAERPLHPEPVTVVTTPEAGPRPPKKPPEKRPHDATWSDIKLLPGRH